MSKKKKILFINANPLVIGGPVVPLGLGYLFRALEERFDYEYIDLGYYFSINDINLDGKDFSLVLVSLRNYDNSDMFDYFCYFDFYNELISYIKQKTQCPILVGGSAFLVEPVELFSLPGDYFLLGYWEDKIADLCEDILNNKQNLSYTNLYVKKNNYLKMNPKIQNFTLSPNRSIFNKSFFNDGDSGSIEFSRGCGQKCIYCSIPRNFSNIVFKDLEMIDSELLDLAKLGYKEIFIVDNLINQNIEFLKTICNLLIQKEYNFIFTAQFHPKFFDEEMLLLMNKAGIQRIQMSLCSYNDRVLKIMKKGFTCKDIDQVIKSMVYHNFDIYVDFTLGNLYESKEEILRTIEYANCLENKHIHVSLHMGLRRFKNTELYDLTLNYNDKIFYFPELDNNAYIEKFEKKNISFVNQNKLYKFLLTRFSDSDKRKLYIQRKMKDLNQKNT